MPATLLTGAAGQGKTHAAIRKIKRLTLRDPLSSVWVLLPNDLQISAFRARLLTEIQEPAHFGLEFFDFSTLYARLLEIAGTPQRRIHDTARFRILRHILTETQADLRHFGTIAETPGFVRLAANFIRELKQALIPPETFSAAATTDRDRDLAGIYSAYQDFLRRKDFVDREGEGWLALAQLQNSPLLKIPAKLLIVDGYDQFDRVQAQLLTLLAARIEGEMLLTLTYQPERAMTAHRRFAQTRQRLLELDTDHIWKETPITDPPPMQRSPALAYLSDRLFEANPRQFPDDGTLSNTVRLMEAPDLRREVQWVLREVKRLLLEGTLPDQIAIVARNLTDYMPYFLETVPAYGLPLIAPRGAPLAENPAVATLLALIDLAAGDFRRRATIDVLRSPYVQPPDLTPAQIDELDRISRKQIVIGGHAQWFSAVKFASTTVQYSDDEDEPPERIVDPQLSDGLKAFFERVTPPAQATARKYIEWLETLIGADPVAKERDEDAPPPPPIHFHMIERIRAGTPAIVARDLGAFKCLKDVFFDVLSAYELVNSYDEIAWADFRRDLQIAIDNVAIDASRIGNRLERVLLASVFEARGLVHDHIFLIGLSESQFPAPTPEDALYLDAERRLMQQRHLPLLTRFEAPDEGSLFYEITSLARRSLTLTRPYIDLKGNEWPASPYWRSVQEVIAVKPERLPIAAGVSIEAAAQPSELTTALAETITNNGVTMLAAAAHNWLLSRDRLASRWRNALHGHTIETRRADPTIPHDAHSGYLTNPALRAYVADLLGPEHLWSASQLGNYGTCPYGFFARRILTLEPIEEPAEGMDPRQIGSLYHVILEQTYRLIAAEGLTIRSDHTQRALEILDAVFDEVLPTAPQKYRFRVTRVWAQEQMTMRRKLIRFVEMDFSDNSPIGKILPGERRPIQQELRFGNDNDYLVIDGEAGPIRVRGAIDRVDERGGQVVVIDYKSGSTRIPIKELLEGRNVQMLVYLFGARQFMAHRQVVGGAFWYLSKCETIDAVLADMPELDIARDALHVRILDARNGNFVNSPSKPANNKCSDYCEFYQLCRVNAASRNKAVVNSPTP